MSNKERYDKVFMEILEIKEEQLSRLVYQGVSSWDSVGHMNLIGEFEEVFGIEMETDDVMAFSGYEKGMEVLAKYGVEF